MRTLLFSIAALILSITPQGIGGKAGIGGKSGFGGGANVSQSLTACGSNYGNGVSTVVVTTTCTAVVGGRLLAAIELVGGTNDCADASDGISGVSNSGTALTWVRDVINSTYQQCLYSAYVGTQLNSGGTITATCATSSACNTDVHVFYDSLSLSSSALDGTGGTTQIAGTGASPITVTNSGAVTATDICLAFGWSSTGSANPFTADWTNSFIQLLGSHNIQFGTGNLYMTYGWIQASTGTPSSAAAWAGGGGNYAGGLIACYKE